MKDKDSVKWPTKTDEGEWKTVTVNLKSGMNVLVWKTMGMSLSRHKIKKPVLIKKIEIYGGWHRHVLDAHQNLNIARTENFELFYSVQILLPVII